MGVTEVQPWPVPDFTPNAAFHFRLYFYAAVLNLIERVSDLLEGRDAALQAYPFLAGYLEEASLHGAPYLPVGAPAHSLEAAIQTWENTVTGHLPLRALRQHADLRFPDLLLLMTIGLVEEDRGFSLVFETLQEPPGQPRPAVGLLRAWFDECFFDHQFGASLWHLQELGLIRVIQPEAPRPGQQMRVPLVLWDAISGSALRQPGAWLHYEPYQQSGHGHPILTGELRLSLDRLLHLVECGDVGAVVVRGPHGSQRRALLGELASRQELGLLEVNGESSVDDERWRLVGLLATLLHALPVLNLDLAPGATANVPRLSGYTGPLGIVVGKDGGLSGPPIERAVTLLTSIPDLQTRREHWLTGLAGFPADDLDLIGERFHMTAGSIQSAAEVARAYAQMAGREVVTLQDARYGSRALNRQILETLAVYVPGFGDWDSLAVGDETRCELDVLESRCRHRERLKNAVSRAVSAQMTSGVRALLTGPSGTGKTLAARILAEVLQKDLYRLDLSSVVNKYIGETEKNLSQLFSRAEELDVILLIDEGDALLTQRTSVQSSNDRYANLETNFLLQRLETYEGILLITTNAQDRIDRAFERRMDIVIEFRRPTAAERQQIWHIHLPPLHTVDGKLLQEISTRCELTGAQIRSAVLHASLLALEDGGSVTSEHLETSVRREYDRSGGICPLRPAVRGK